MSDLDQLTGWASAFLSRLEPAARRTLLRAVVAELRRRQATRIAEQRNPDGTAYEPRKPQLQRRTGALRRAMFARMRTARFLKTDVDDSSAAVTFAANTQRIAQVHQYGLRDRVNRGSLRVKYAQRELLGFADGDVERLADLVFSYLAK